MYYDCVQLNIEDDSDSVDDDEINDSDYDDSVYGRDYK